MCVSGSYEPPGQFVAAACAGHRQRRDRTFGLLTTGGVNIGPDPVPRDELHRLGAELRREVDQIVDRAGPADCKPAASSEMAASAIPLARHVAFRHRPLLDRPDRLPGHAIEDVQKRLLGRLRDGLDRPAVDRDVGENRRARDVHVPDAVVHELIMPLPLSGLQSTATRLSPNSPSPGRCAAVVVAGRHFDRQICHPSSSSTDICAHAPVLPVYAQESFCHVSLPNSPGCGNRVERSRGACRSARRSRGHAPSRCACSSGFAPVLCAAPTMTRSRRRSAWRRVPDRRVRQVDLGIEILLLLGRGREAVGRGGKPRGGRSGSHKGHSVNLDPS